MDYVTPQETIKVAQAKRLGYQALGPAGWGTAFVKALLAETA